jgi:hypothetical protein
LLHHIAGFGFGEVFISCVGRCEPRKKKHILVAMIKKFGNRRRRIGSHSFDVFSGAVIKRVRGVLNGNVAQQVAQHRDLRKRDESQQDDGEHLYN